MTHDQKEKWMDRLISWGWVVVVAVISTFITIKVTIAEIQTQIRSTQEQISVIQQGDKDFADRIRAMELQDVESREQRQQIFKQLEKIEQSQKEIMQLLSKLLADTRSGNKR